MSELRSMSLEWLTATNTTSQSSLAKIKISPRPPTRLEPSPSNSRDGSRLPALFRTRTIRTAGASTQQTGYESQRIPMTDVLTPGTTDPDQHAPSAAKG